MEGMLGELGEELFFQTPLPRGLQQLGVREEAKGKGTSSSPVLQQFLGASMDTIRDEGWIEALSCELSRWLSSSASSSAEKVSSPRLHPAVQLQVSNWGWGCGWCSAHAGCWCCFPSLCPQRAFPCKLPRDG